MKTKIAVLTKEERDILILAALHPHGKFLSNSEIGQRLGTSVNRVKTLIHQACVKLGAHNRNEAILFAIRRGDINLTDIYSLEELAEQLSSLDPDILRGMSNVVRQMQERGHLPRKDEQTILMKRIQDRILTNRERDVPILSRKQDCILTNRERDVLILVGCGLTNKEIAGILYMSTGSVRIFLNRAYTKLGACKRSDAVILALKQREISICDIISLNEMIHFLAPLGAETLEKVAQLVSQKLGQEPIPTGS